MAYKPLFQTAARAHLLASDGTYVAQVRHQTLLYLAATGARTRSLSLDLSSSDCGRRYTRIGTGPKRVVANTLSGIVTKTAREGHLLAGCNRTSVDASLHPRR